MVNRLIGSDAVKNNHPEAGAGVVVSLSTIPARFSSLSKCVDSILNQTRPPDQVVVNIPRYYKRFKITVNDDELPNLDYPRVVINRCEDSGPGTKLLGAMNFLHRDDLVVLVDDDLCYHDRFLETLVDCSVTSQSAASFHVYQVEAGAKHMVGQGADGFAIPCSALAGIESYFEMIAKNHHLFLNDDLWISFFLEMKGVGITNCGETHDRSGLENEPSRRPEVLTQEEGLVDIKGRYSRWRSVYRGIRYLERKRPWLEAKVGLRESTPRFSPKVFAADVLDLIRR